MGLFAGEFFLILEIVVNIFSYIIIPDFARTFIVTIDFSSLGISAILSQRDVHEREYVVSYASRSLTVIESNYSSYEGELLGVMFGL